MTNDLGVWTADDCALVLTVESTIGTPKALAVTASKADVHLDEVGARLRADDSNISLLVVDQAFQPCSSKGPTNSSEHAGAIVPIKPTPACPLWLLATGIVLPM